MQVTSICVRLCVSNSAKISQLVLFTSEGHHCEYDEVALKISTNDNFGALLYFKAWIIDCSTNEFGR